METVFDYKQTCILDIQSSFPQCASRTHIHYSCDMTLVSDLQHWGHSGFINDHIFCQSVKNLYIPLHINFPDVTTISTQCIWQHSSGHFEDISTMSFKYHLPARYKQHAYNVEICVACI